MDYGDAEAEYFAIRNSCAMFDVSPIRKISIRGSMQEHSWIAC